MDSNSDGVVKSWRAMRGQVKRLNKSGKLFFFKFLGLGRRGRGGSHSLPGRLIACVASHWLVEMGEAERKIKGRTLVGRNRLQKSAVHSLASRRQKPRPCLAPAMTQGAKNYKVRQPPPFRALKFASAKTRLAPSPTPQLHHQSDRSGLHPSVEVSIGIDIISIVPFRAQLCRDARFSVLYWEGKH